jgi:hypothetical protein
MLTRSHGKEESAEDCICCLGVGRGQSGKQSKQLSEKLWYDGFLVTRQGVGVVASFQKGPDGGEQLGVSFDVKGAPLELHPKRRSQIACGISDSQQNHGALTLAKKGSCPAPVSTSAKGKEGSDDELAFLLVQASEERVVGEAGLGAEGEPSAPGSVSSLVGFFLLGFKDDSVICSARMTKEEISLGSVEMTKSSGINCGR